MYYNWLLKKKKASANVELIQLTDFAVLNSSLNIVSCFTSQISPTKGVYSLWDTKMLITVQHTRSDMFPALRQYSDICFQPCSSTVWQTDKMFTNFNGSRSVLWQELVPKTQTICILHTDLLFLTTCSCNRRQWDTEVMTKWKYCFT